MQQEQHCHRRTVNFDHTGLWDSESILIILGSGTLDSGTLGWTDNRINNSMAWTAPEKAQTKQRQALWYAACMAKERNHNYMVVASKLARPRWVLRAQQAGMGKGKYQAHRPTQMGT